MDYILSVLKKVKTFGEEFDIPFKRNIKKQKDFLTRIQNCKSERKMYVIPYPQCIDQIWTCWHAVKINYSFPELQ